MKIAQGCATFSRPIEATTDQGATEPMGMLHDVILTACESLGYSHWMPPFGPFAWFVIVNQGKGFNPPDGRGAARRCLDPSGMPDGLGGGSPMAWHSTRLLPIGNLQTRCLNLSTFVGTAPTIPGNWRWIGCLLASRRTWVTRNLAV